MIIANNFNNVRHFVSILFFAKIGVVTLFFPAPLSFGHGCERLLTCWTWMWQSRSARSLPRSFRAAQFYQERGGWVEPLEIPTKMKTRFAVPQTTICRVYEIRLQVLKINLPMNQ